MGQHGTVRRPAAAARWEGGIQSDLQFVVGNLLILGSLIAGVVFLAGAGIGSNVDQKSVAAGILFLLLSQAFAPVVVLSANKVVIDGDFIAWQPRLHRRALRKYRWHQIKDVQLYNANGWIWGWGLRWHPKIGWGHIVKSGPAIRIIKNNGRSFVITVVDAQTAVETAQKFLAGKTN